MAFRWLPTVKKRCRCCTLRTSCRTDSHGRHHALHGRFEALTQIKADPRLQAIPVVMASARSRDADILEGEERGAIRYLSKPINPAELLTVVREQVGAPTPD